MRNRTRKFEALDCRTLLSATPLSAAAFLGSSLSAAAAAPAAAEVQGHVAAGAANAPLGTTIQIIDELSKAVVAKTATDASGDYQVPGLAPGHYEVQATVEFTNGSHRTDSDDIRVSAGQDGILNLDLGAIPSTDVPRAAPVAPPAPVTPAAIAPSKINLSTWNLTLPTGKSDDPTVISTAQLVAGYSSPYFYTNSQGLNFWAPVNGVSTSGSDYPRSELRETHADGTLYNWHATDFKTSSLSATLDVGQVPSTGKVVVGQIHGVENGQPLVKLVWESGTLVAQIRNTPTGSNQDYTLAKGLALGQHFSYAITLSSSDVLTISINGTVEHTQSVSSSWNDIGLYFKAGSYVQDNSGPSTEGALVTFQNLAIKHAN